MKISITVLLAFVSASAFASENKYCFSNRANSALIFTPESALDHSDENPNIPGAIHSYKAIIWALESRAKKNTTVFEGTSIDGPLASMYWAQFNKETYVPRIVLFDAQGCVDRDIVGFPSDESLGVTFSDVIGRVSSIPGKRRSPFISNPSLAR